MIESKYLKDNLANINRLYTIPAFKGVETKDLGQLLKICKIRQYGDGEIIIEEGGNDPWLYFIMSGKVQVFKKGIVIHAFHKVGDIFGEKRFLDNFTRAETVSSEGKTICLAIDTSAKARIGPEVDVDRLVKILYLIIADFLSVRLREANEKLIKCKMENIVLRAKLEDLTS